MKKTFVYLLTIIGLLTLGISGSMYVKYKEPNKSHGLYQVYENTEDIFNDSELIIYGKVISKPMQIERKLEATTFYEDLYSIEIVELHKSPEGSNLKEGDFIPYSVTKQYNRNGQLYDIEHVSLDKEMHLLFLNTYTDENSGEVVYVDTSPGHVYEKENSNFINISSDSIKTMNPSTIEKLAEEDSK